MTDWAELLLKDRLGRLEFFGGPAADLFTREFQESLDGTLRFNVYGPAAGTNAGFVSASVQGRACSGQFWSRDGATFARELIHFGYINHAAMVMDQMLSLAKINEQGYYTLPMYWLAAQPASGNELDGTAGMVISLIQLWRRLDRNDPRKAKYYRFLREKSSPLAYILHEMSRGPLIPGHGEFGGGMHVDGLHCNVVQNGLCRLALVAAAFMEEEGADAEKAKAYHSAANHLAENMERYLTASDGGWLWCVDARTLKPDPVVLDAYWNRGFSGIEGVCCMQADTCGFDTANNRWRGVVQSKATHARLAAEPYRRELFDRSGMWPQFGSPPYDKLTSASYGQSYAIQTMLLLDRLDEAERAIDYLAQATFSPPPAYNLTRESPYWFYERYLAPEFTAIEKYDQGCGALNLINVCEPLKAARLVAGIDDTGDTPLILPRLPASWQGFRAHSWPLCTRGGVIYADVEYMKTNGEENLTVKTLDNAEIPELKVQLGAPGARRVFAEHKVRECRLQVEGRGGSSGRPSVVSRK